jgi:hypothetical protein
MTQRHLGDPPEDDPAPEAVEEHPAPALETVAPPAVPSAPALAVPHGPSDVELRKRQRAWQQERARFESSRQHRRPTEEEPK